MLIGKHYPDHNNMVSVSRVFIPANCRTAENPYTFVIRMSNAVYLPPSNVFVKYRNRSNFHLVGFKTRKEAEVERLNILKFINHNILHNKKEYLKPANHNYWLKKTVYVLFDKKLQEVIFVNHDLSNIIKASQTLKKPTSFFPSYFVDHWNQLCAFYPQIGSHYTIFERHTNYDYYPCNSK